jgi:hypothetical protein
MIVIASLAVGLGVILIAGLMLVLDRAGVAGDITNSLGTAFVGPYRATRAPHIQEEDVPRFVFRTATPAGC